MLLSIIIPLYNEQSVVIELLQKLSSVQLPPIVKQYEIIIVDDCSQDQSFQKVSEFISGKLNFILVKLNW